MSPNLIYLAGIHISFLFVASIFLNKGPHNIMVGLAALFSFFLIFRHFTTAKRIFKDHLWFFSALLMYFLWTFFINYYHFGNNEFFIDAVEESRWSILGLLFCPALSIFQTHYRKKDLPKVFTSYTYISFLILISIMAIDTYYRLSFSDLSPIAQILTKSAEHKNSSRASWLYSPIFFSQIITFLGMCIFLFFYKKKPLIRKNLFHFLWVILPIACILMAFLSKTRATWIALVLSFAFLSFFSAPIRRLSLVFAFLLPLGLFAFPTSSISKRALSIFSTKKVSNAYRLEHWKANLKIAKDHPFLGIGYKENRKSDYVEKYVENRISRYSLKHHGHPHNEYLEVSSGMGIPALALMLMAFFYPLVIAAKDIRLGHMNSTVILTSYLLIAYVSAFFDQISFLTWSTILITWSLLFAANLKQTENFDEYSTLRQ